MSTEAILDRATMGYRAEILERATHYASDYVARVARKLELHGHDLNVIAPLPTSKMDRDEYVEKKNARRSIELLVDRVAARRRKGDPCIVHMNPEKADRYICESRASAGANVDCFIFKMGGKVGSIIAAKSDGVPIWDGSIMTITKPDGTTELWYTRMVVCMSKLGKLYNQWRMRRLK